MTLDELIGQLTELRNKDPEYGACPIYASQTMGAWVQTIDTVKPYDGVEIYLYGRKA